MVVSNTLYVGVSISTYRSRDVNREAVIDYLRILFAFFDVCHTSLIATSIYDMLDHLHLHLTGPSSRRIANFNSVTCGVLSPPSPAFSQAAASFVYLAPSTR